MKTSPQASDIDARDCINLRIATELLGGIDEARQQRPGFVSRNTWITEAIEEKLTRESSQRMSGDKRSGGHA